MSSEKPFTEIASLPVSNSISDEKKPIKPQEEVQYKHAVEVQVSSSTTTASSVNNNLQQQQQQPLQGLPQVYGQQLQQLYDNNFQQNQQQLVPQQYNAAYPVHMPPVGYYSAVPVPYNTPVDSSQQQAQAQTVVMYPNQQVQFAVPQYPNNGQFQQQYMYPYPYPNNYVNQNGSNASPVPALPSNSVHPQHNIPHHNNHNNQMMQHDGHLVASARYTQDELYVVRLHRAISSILYFLTVLSYMCIGVGIGAAIITMRQKTTYTTVSIILIIVGAIGLFIMICLSVGYLISVAKTSSVSKRVEAFRLRNALFALVFTIWPLSIPFFIFYGCGRGIFSCITGRNCGYDLCANFKHRLE